MRAVSTLRLSEQDRQLFRAALERYGYEDGASFLRACARALIIAHQQQQELLRPVAFKPVLEHE